MRTTRILRVGSTFAALALVATACGDDGGADDGLGLVNEGTLTVCSDIPYPPFEMEAEGGGYTGFDIDLVNAVADEMGVETEVVVTGFEGIQSGASLAADQCDVAASAMTITEEREENLDFSEPYFDADQSLLVPADSDISSLEDLSGEQLGVQSETTGADYARENAPEDVEIVEFPGAGELFAALEAGQVSGVLQDFPVNLNKANEDENFEVVQEYETGEQYGFAVAEEGSDELLTAINDALETLRDDGTYDEIFQEYFPGAEA